MSRRSSQLPLGLDPKKKASNSHSPCRLSARAQAGPSLPVQQAGIISIVRLQMVRDGTIKYGNKQITSPTQLARLVHDYLGVPNREHFVAICLDTKNKPTHIETVHIGSINFSIVSPAEIYKLALNSNAAAVALAHNHPSGDPSPSQDDLKITEKLIKAGEIMGIPVLDHVIIGNTPEVFYSFKENNLI